LRAKVDHCPLRPGALAVQVESYPTLSDEEIKALHPDTVLLSSEPYPFNFGHRVELHTPLPQTNMEMVDGELFSWYGPKMLETVRVIGEQGICSFLRGKIITLRIGSRTQWRPFFLTYIY
jgi:hypothetical protein